MKLRSQLALLGLLTLSFPLAGWFLFQAMHRDIQDSIIQGALAQARTVAAGLKKTLVDGRLPAGLPVAPLSADMQLDGSEEDWRAIAMHEYGAVLEKHIGVSLPVPLSGLHSALRLGKDPAGRWWLWIRVFDASINRPTGQASIMLPDELPLTDTAKPGDRLVLGLVVAGRNHRLVFARQAEGALRNDEQTTPAFTAWQGVWHELADGYAIEMRLPASVPLQRLGFAARDAAGLPTYQYLTGSLSPDSANTIVLQPLLDEIHPLAMGLRNLLADQQENPAQALVLDHHGRVLARSPAVAGPAGKPWQWLYGALYQWLFGSPASVDRMIAVSADSADVMTQKTTNAIQWPQMPKNPGTMVQARVPLGDGWLVLQKPLNAEQQSLIQTLLRGALIAFVLTVLVVAVYMLYASVLAWRVRRLNRSLQQALDSGGRVHTDLPSLNAGDEIGELARGLHGLLQQVREHTAYLKSFGSRLSHELKTPLVMVQGSLDNMATVGQGGPGHVTDNELVFLSRARDGVARMRFILNQLASLSRLHEALENTPLEKIDLAPFLHQYAAARAALMPNLRLEVSNAPLWARVSLDLLAQALDKLLDNARDFTPADGSIVLQANRRAGQSGQPQVVLGVFNSGSQLPAEIEQSRLFEHFTTRRRSHQRSDAGHHLGLGLYLVRLIAEYHGGQVLARNTRQPRGVLFELILPASEDPQPAGQAAKARSLSG